MTESPFSETDAYYRAMTDKQLRAILAESGVESLNWYGAKQVLADRAAERQERLIRRTYWAAVAALIASMIGVEDEIERRGLDV